MIDFNDAKGEITLAGRSVGKSFRDYEDEPVLTIGRHTWTRLSFARELGIGHYRAGRILTDVCKRLKVKSPHELGSRVTIDDIAAYTGVGAATLMVAMSVADAVGGDRKVNDLLTTKETKNGGREPITFATLKRRAAER